MDKEKDLFVNDGYFMERFKRLQQEKGAVAAATDQPISITSSSSSVALKPTTIVSKRPLEDKFNDIKTENPQTSRGKLAFSLKWKTKVTLAPVKFIAIEEEEAYDTVVPRDEHVKHQKLDQGDTHHSSSQREDVACVF